jgi:hypothetical protein
MKPDQKQLGVHRLLHAWNGLAKKLIQDLAKTISESTPKIIYPIKRSKKRNHHRYRRRQAMCLC